MYGTIDRRPQAPVDKEAIRNYKMPAPYVGAAVVWYATGAPQRNAAQLAFVRHVGTRNIGLQLPTGTRVDAVRHVSDPKLQLSADQRENGAWDFTEQDVVMERRLRLLMERIERLEGAEPAQPKKTQKAPHLRALSELRKHAKALGGKDVHKMKKQELIDLIESHGEKPEGA